MTSIRRGLTLGVKSGGPKGLSLTGPTSPPGKTCVCAVGDPRFSQWTGRRVRGVETGA